MGRLGVEWEVEVSMSMMGVRARVGGRGRVVVHTYTLCCLCLLPPTTQATDPSRLNATVSSPGLASASREEQSVVLARASGVESRWAGRTWGFSIALVLIWRRRRLRGGEGSRWRSDWCGAFFWGGDARVLWDLGSRYGSDTSFSCFLWLG
jgi:hypothetical protein